MSKIDIYSIFKLNDFPGRGDNSTFDNEEEKIRTFFDDDSNNLLKFVVWENLYQMTKRNVVKGQVRDKKLGQLKELKKKNSTSAKIKRISTQIKEMEHWYKTDIIGKRWWGGEEKRKKKIIQQVRRHVADLKHKLRTVPLKFDPLIMVCLYDIYFTESYKKYLSPDYSSKSSLIYLDNIKMWPLPYATMKNLVGQYVALKLSKQPEEVAAGPMKDKLSADRWIDPSNEKAGKTPGEWTVFRMVSEDSESVKKRMLSTNTLYNREIETLKEEIKTATVVAETLKNSLLSIDQKLKLKSDTKKKEEEELKKANDEKKTGLDNLVKKKNKLIEHQDKIKYHKGEWESAKLKVSSEQEKLGMAEKNREIDLTIINRIIVSLNVTLSALKTDLEKVILQREAAKKKIDSKKKTIDNTIDIVEASDVEASEKANAERLKRLNERTKKIAGVAIEKAEADMATAVADQTRLELEIILLTKEIADQYTKLAKSTQLLNDSPAVIVKLTENIKEMNDNISASKYEERIAAAENKHTPLIETIEGEIVVDTKKQEELTEKILKLSKKIAEYDRNIVELQLKRKEINVNIDNLPELRHQQKELEQQLEANKTILEDLEKNPKDFCEFEVDGVVHSIHHEDIQIQKVDDHNSVNQYTHFYSLVKKLLHKDYDEKKEKDDYEMVPKNPFLLYSFLVDKRNVSIISPKILTIITGMKKYMPELFEDWFTTSEKLQKTAYHQTGPTETLLERVTSGEKLSQKSDVTVSSQDSDMTQGYQFTENGHVAVLMFLGLVIHRSTTTSDYNIDLSKSQEDWYLQAYEWVAREQEKALQEDWNGHWLSYTFNVSNSTSGTWNPPKMSATAPQSLRNLNMRGVGKHLKPLCSACAEGFETYHGDFAGLIHTLDEGGSNDNGICVFQIDRMVVDWGGISDNEKKNNSAYLNWIGTWEQMERREKAYMKKQQELYDNSDPRYSLIKYYMNLMYFKMDVWFRYLLGIKNSKSEEEQEKADKAAKLQEKADAELATPDDSLWEKAKQLAKDVFEMVWKAAKFLGKTLQQASWVLYKIIDVAMRMPIIRQAILKLVEKLVDKLCIKMSIAEGDYAITNDKGEEFDHDLGMWYQMSHEKQEKISKDESDAIWKKRKDKLGMFVAVMKSFGADGAGSFLGDGLLALDGVFSEAFNKAIGLFRSIPYVKELFNFIGIGEKSMKAMIMGGIRSQGRETFNTILQINSGASDMMRLFDAIEKYGKCLTGGGDEIIFKNGVVLGENEPYLYFAFEKALFNVPYYAVQILNEFVFEQEREKGNKTIFLQKQSNVEMEKLTDEEEQWQEYRDITEGKKWSTMLGLSSIEELQDDFIREKTLYHINKGIATEWLVPGGDDACEPSESEQSKDQYAQSALLAKLEVEKRLYLVRKKRSDEYWRRQQTSYGFEKGGHLNTNKEQDKEELAIYKEFIEKLNAADAELDKAILQEQHDNMMWWAGALLAGAAIGLFVATGGVGLIVAAVAPYAAAATASVTAAATATSTALGTAGTYIATSTVGTAVTSMATSAGGQMVTAAVKGAIFNEIRAIQNDQGLMTALKFEASQMLYGAVAASWDYISHFSDASKFFSLANIFAISDIWREIFIHQLTEKIELFRNKLPSHEDTKLLSLQFRERFARNRSIVIKWAGIDCDFLNLDICANFFEHYGDMPILKT